MPTLRERLKRPETYLILLALFVLATAADAFRTPERQVTARLYVGLVEFYQADLSPTVSRYIRCRYQPTCSEYSRQAVLRFGIIRGLVLSERRIRSCRHSVPMGTYDPVPVR